MVDWTFLYCIILFIVIMLCLAYLFKRVILEKNEKIEIRSFDILIIFTYLVTMLQLYLAIN
jgi:hypothetical protein